MAERDTHPGALPLRTAEGQLSSDTENGHADSPDESLSPTSVIYFKEAYSSANLSFGHAGGAALSLGGPPPHFDFRIERIDSKRRSELSAVQLGVTGTGVLSLPVSLPNSCRCQQIRHKFTGVQMYHSEYKTHFICT